MAFSFPPFLLFVTSFPAGEMVAFDMRIINFYAKRKKATRDDSIRLIIKVICLCFELLTVGG